MVLLKSVDSGLQVAYEIALRTSEKLSDTARKIYTALVATGLEVAAERKYSPKVSQVVFFACAESVALAVGIHPATLYRRLPELRKHGLVDCRGHYCTHNGRTRSDGSVWCVRLTPTWGSAARVPYDFLKRQYRSLGDDISKKKTAYEQMRESYPTRDKRFLNIQHILRWALSTPTQNPSIIDSRTAQRVDLESIFDVPHALKQERPDMVYKAAQAMSSTLGDASSTRWFCAVLWGLLRVRDRGEGDYFQSLYLMVCRIRADRDEQFARNPCALLTSRLKEAPFWNEIRQQSLRARLQPT